MPKFLTLAAVCGMCCMANGATSTVGLAKADGEFRLDQSVVRNNGTVLEGGSVETISVRSEIRIDGGVRLALMPGSKSTVYRDRAVLEKGSGELTGSYVLEARSLNVAPAEKESVAQVDLSRPKLVTVSASRGAVNVRNSSGVLVARVFPGRALEFDPEAGSGIKEVKLSGKLTKEKGAYILTDDKTSVKMELRGAGLAALVGKKVSVTGTQAGSSAVQGASALVQVGAITPISGAAAAAGGATAAAVAGHGIGVGTMAVIGGVAVGGAVGGLAASGAIGGGEDPVSRP